MPAAATDAGPEAFGERIVRTERQDTMGDSAVGTAQERVSRTHAQRCTGGGWWVHLPDLGLPNGQFLGRASGYGCDSVVDLGYSPALPGRFEDGAYRASSETLWRVTYDGHLHETTRGGSLVQSYSVPAGLVGLAWAGAALYATNFAGGTIGGVTLGSGSATYAAIPWLGSPPVGSPAGLTYDPQSDTLYLATSAGQLYSVAIAAGNASATLVEDLTAVGYPAGALPDGLGWISPCPTPADPLTVLFAGDRVTLEWTAVPGATYDVVSHAFARDVAGNAWTGAGGLLQSMTCRADDIVATSFDTTGLADPDVDHVWIWLVRVCAGSWNAAGAVDRDAEIPCP